MNVLLERLRAALAPRGILVEQELASGGQGTVFRARDQGLQKALAVKILRPELASATAVERFQREARILARFTHPRIVPIHSTGFADGIPYYTMDLLSGETLRDRLRSGPLPAKDVVRLGRDLLAALSAAHRRGVVHRDVKPGNIFLVRGRGILTDFGVAKQLADDGPGVTGPDGAGTKAYMPPEQSVGAEVTPRTDLYALGIVLYEALTGREWKKVEAPERADWTGVPVSLRPALRRALAWSQQDRWPNATAFARALQRRSHWPAAALASVTVAAITLVLWKFLPASRRPMADLRVERLTVQDAGAAKWLADSLSARLTAQLRGFPDFTVLGVGESGRARNAVTGAIVGQAPAVRAMVRLDDGEPITVSLVPARWHDAADELVDSVLAEVFRGQALDMVVPVGVLPRAPRAFKAFLDAEKLLAAGHWAEADIAYVRATELDPSCWLCIWRHAESSRWVGMTNDTISERFLLNHIGEFPLAYQTLIRVDTLPTLARLDTLGALTSRQRRFPLGWFRLADERLHRGPLVGFPRRAADAPLRETLRLRPDFVPALEHLAWLMVVEGDSEAQTLVDSLRHLPQARRSPGGIGELVQVAWAWRSLPASGAGDRTAVIVQGARAEGITDVDAGARYLNAFDVPRGAIALGRLIEPEHRTSGRIAQVIAWLELGRPDSAMDVLRRELLHTPTPELTLFRAELGAMLRMFSFPPVSPDAPVWGGAERELRALAAESNLPSRLRGRAAWMADLVTCRSARGLGRVSAFAVDLPVSDTLRALSAACRLANQSRIDSALVLTQPLVGLRAGQVGGDPFFRAALHLFRSEWWARLNRLAPAMRELVWFENSDQDNLPTLDPQPMEVDWAFGVQARWRWVALLDEADGSAEERCRLYRDVARLWADGAAAYAARALDARRQLHALGCAGPAQ
jgi:hypothetical protein